MLSPSMSEKLAEDKSRLLSVSSGDGYAGWQGSCWVIVDRSDIDIDCLRGHGIATIRSKHREGSDIVAIGVLRTGVFNITDSIQIGVDSGCSARKGDLRTAGQSGCYLSTTDRSSECTGINCQGNGEIIAFEVRKTGGG